MELIYVDEKIIVCVKPAGAPSTDVPGGVPGLVRKALGDPQANVRTVHRLDQMVSGLMVLARTRRAASDLSEQVRNGTFQKEYQAVVHGCPAETSGEYRDLLLRNKEERKTYVVTQPGKDVQEAVLTYRVISRTETLSRVHIRLQTGRTHQIRAQFSSRGLPLVGDRKYGAPEAPCTVALFSCHLAFVHPATGRTMEFTLDPPRAYPWADC